MIVRVAWERSVELRPRKGLGLCLVHTPVPEAEEVYRMIPVEPERLDWDSFVDLSSALEELGILFPVGALVIEEPDGSVRVDLVDCETDATRTWGRIVKSSVGKG